MIYSTSNKYFSSYLIFISDVTSNAFVDSTIDIDIKSVY